MNILYLMMGGVGSRLGSEIPKQFINVHGSPIFYRILKLYNKSNLIDHVVIVCNPKWIEHMNKELEAREFNFSISVTPGGKTRAESVKNALKHTYQMIDTDRSSSVKVLIHDATHPYLDLTATTHLCNILDSNPAATLVSHVWDTVYLSSDKGEKINSTLPRANIAVGASPEGFKLDLLGSIFDDPSISMFTSVADFLISKGYTVELVWTKKINIKVTYPDDLSLYKEGFSYFEKLE